MGWVHSVINRSSLRRSAIFTHTSLLESVILIDTSFSEGVNSISADGRLFSVSQVNGMDIFIAVQDRG